MLAISPQAARNQLALRGAAALAIVLGHLWFLPYYQMGFADAAHGGVLSNLVLFHFLAVEVFFMLSGCVLCLKYWEQFSPETPPRAFDRFTLKRLARIYPLHLLGTAIIGFYALIGVAHPIASGLEGKIFEHWEWTGLLNLLLMHGWGIVPVAAWNEPSWTLSVLFLLYILFPNLVLGMRRLTQKPRVFLGLAVGVLAAYTAARLSLSIGSGSDGAGGLLRGLVMFIIGMSLARLHQLTPASARSWDAASALSAALLLAMIAAWWQFGPFDLWPMHAAIAFMVFAALRAEGPISRAVSCVPLVWLGRISFALYIMHYPVMLGIGHWFSPALAELASYGSLGLAACYALTLAAVVGVAWATWRWIETPISSQLARALR